MMKTTATVLLIILGLPGNLSGAQPAEVDAVDQQQESACAGMSDGDFMGVEICNECHEDTVTAMQMTVHGEALEDCEVCHGPGSMHLEEVGECIISMKGRFGESVEMLNGICLECHEDEALQQWSDGTHGNIGVACADCHQIHGERHVTERQYQAGICYGCHPPPIGTETYSPYGHSVRHDKLLCSSCHNPHGATRRLERCRCTPWKEE